MYQKDYILRIIEEFFRFLGQILKLKSEKEYVRALDLIDQASKNFLKVNLNDIVINEQLDKEILSNLNFDQLRILAELLKAKADIFNETNSHFSATSYYQLSLGLFEYVHEGSKNYSVDIADRIYELKKILN